MSASPGALASYRPALRPRVLLSDPLLDGPSTIHLIKDTDTGNSFKVGTKEHFLIARMDGGRSLAEIGEEYAGEYGRRLGDAHWQQILTMLGTKGLLTGTPLPEALFSRRSPAPSCAAPCPWWPTPTPPPPASTGSSASCSRPGRWCRCWC